MDFDILAAARITLADALRRWEAMANTHSPASENTRVSTPTGPDPILASNPQIPIRRQ